VRVPAGGAEEGDDLVAGVARGPGREEREDGVQGRGRQGHVRGRPRLELVFLVVAAEVADELHGEYGEVPRCRRDLHVARSLVGSQTRVLAVTGGCWPAVQLYNATR
jgi:hypothetical protein